MDASKCIYCDKKMNIIKNDWKTRKFHKSCYKDFKEKQILSWKLSGMMPM